MGITEASQLKSLGNVNVNKTQNIKLFSQYKDMSGYIKVLDRGPKTNPCGTP